MRYFTSIEVLEQTLKILYTFLSKQNLKKIVDYVKTKEIDYIALNCPRVMIMINHENIIWRYIVLQLACVFQNIVEISLKYHRIFFDNFTQYLSNEHTH